MSVVSTVQNLGMLSGKLLIFGGVYSNLPALERLMDLADDLQIPPRNIICTGDMVGYCAEPEDSVRQIRLWGVHCIAGNVEIQLRNREEDCGCNFNEGSRCDLLAQKWYPFAQKRLSEANLRWMGYLPMHLRFEYGGKQVYVLHGSYFNPSEFIFRSTPWEVKSANFQATEADIILAGHCGLPFRHEHNGLHWLNAGVIGMPANDGTPRVWFMTIDMDEQGLQIEHHAYEYDHERAASLMERAQLPREYSETLRTGIWDNCEILPEEETMQQGMRLEVATS